MVSPVRQAAAGWGRRRCRGPIDRARWGAGTGCTSGAHLVHMTKVNHGQVRSAAVDKSAGQRGFHRIVAGHAEGLNGFHTAEVGGSRPSSPTRKSPGQRLDTGLIQRPLTGLDSQNGAKMARDRTARNDRRAILGACGRFRRSLVASVARPESTPSSGGPGWGAPASLGPLIRGTDSRPGVVSGARRSGRASKARLVALTGTWRRGWRSDQRHIGTRVLGQVRFSCSAA